MNRWFVCLIAALAGAGAASVCHAAESITVTDAKGNKVFGPGNGLALGAATAGSIVICEGGTLGRDAGCDSAGISDIINISNAHIGQLSSEVDRGDTDPADGGLPTIQGNAVYIPEFLIAGKAGYTPAKPLKGPEPGYDGSLTTQYIYFASSDIEISTPEPATWGLMLAGFGLVGWRLRQRAAAAG
ncbi:MAG: hypothetical protein JWO83_4914 [Caulobacteraceae bacterium]|nr:hypothetical protein [Caulobacteraceae bacterium]